MGTLYVFRIVLVKRIIGPQNGESFSFQQPQSHLAFGRCVGRCAGHLSATSKAFRQQPHKYDRGRQVKFVEACLPFSFGNDTMRRFEKLSVLEHSSNWRFRTDRTHLMSTNPRQGRESRPITARLVVHFRHA